MNLPTRPTQGPMRVPFSTSGSELEVELAELVEAGGREGVAGDVVDDAFEAADLAGGVEDAGLFLAGGAVAEKFHGCSELRVRDDADVAMNRRVGVC